MQNAFVDIHHHFLYGLDDGPASRDEMYRMIDAAAEEGVGCMIATPHFYPGIKPFDQDQYERALAEAKAYCRSRHPQLHIEGGAEVLFTQSAVRMLREGRIPALAQSQQVLVEWTESASAQEVASAVREIANAGYATVIAHAERLPCFWRSPEPLVQLKQEGCVRIQVNASSLLRGPLCLRGWQAKRLCRMQLADYVASDAHDTLVRSVQLQAAYEQQCRKNGAAAAAQLFGGNQQELLMFPAENKF